MHASLKQALTRVQPRSALSTHSCCCRAVLDRALAALRRSLRPPSIADEAMPLWRHAGFAHDPGGLLGQLVSLCLERS